jgi:hypothetical protein
MLRSDERDAGRAPSPPFADAYEAGVIGAGFSTSLGRDQLSRVSIGG